MSETPAPPGETVAGADARLTPYLVGGETPRAAIVVCAGGGYGRRAEHEEAPVARWLNGIGLHAFVLAYRVAPDRHPAPLEDARLALRTVRHRAAAWRVRPDRVGVLGFSAGGHLAAILSTHWDGGRADSPDPVQRESCRPDAAVLCYPVISFLQYAHLGSIRNLLGDAASVEQRRHLSAECCVTAQTPPTFLWHTAADAGVPVEHSLLYAAALAGHGVPFALHVFPTGPHGIGLADGAAGRPGDPQAAAWTGLCAAWLAGLGWR